MREKIADYWAYHRFGYHLEQCSKDEQADAYDAADQIHALYLSEGWVKVESRLVVEADCPDVAYDGCDHRGCGTCHGSGFISRPATGEEVAEIAEEAAKMFIGIKLKSGVRIKLKEKL